jgi:hypothetical protein
MKDLSGFLLAAIVLTTSWVPEEESGRRPAEIGRPRAAHTGSFVPAGDGQWVAEHAGTPDHTSRFALP